MTDQRDVVRRGYDRLGSDYAAARSPDEREAALLSGLLDRLDAGARLLDVGCGDGRPVLSRLGGGPRPGGAADDCPAYGEADGAEGTDHAATVAGTGPPADREDPERDATGARASERDRAADTRPTDPRRARVLGLDLSREQCRRARERVDGSPAVLQGEMTRLPVADGVVDAVTAFHSVIHVPADEHPAVYREFARVLRPGGWLLCSAGEQAWAGRNGSWLDTGVAMEWSFPALEATLAAVEAAGFEVERRLILEDVPDGETWAFVLARLASA